MPLPITSRASVDSNGGQSNSFSLDPTLSADGRFVAFRSAASNLVSSDSNGEDDVFVHDTRTGVTALVSVSSSGVQGNAGSFDAFVSPEGRYVGFASEASNLVPRDTNDVSDVFLRDLARRTTVRVSVSSTGQEANGDCLHASTSAHGRFVAFHSRATNLVVPDANGIVSDVFVHDLATRKTTLVSMSSIREQGNNSSRYPKVTADGRYVVFESTASNLVPLDTNGSSDVFVHDHWSHTTSRVSVSSSGGQANSGSFAPSISASGRFVTFASSASNLVTPDGNGRTDIFLHDRSNGTTSIVSVSSRGEQSDGSSVLSFVSVNGRYVAFSGFANNLVPLDANEGLDVFVRDLRLQTTELASVSTRGIQGRFDSGSPAISTDGRFVAFTADADNLVPNDTNSAKDIFVRGPLAGR